MKIRNLLIVLSLGLLVSSHATASQSITCFMGDVNAEILGKYREKVRVTFGSGESRYFPLSDGTNLRCKGQRARIGDIVSNGYNVVGVRYGNHRDLHVLIGLADNGQVVRHYLPLRDGRHHDVGVFGQTIQIRYGRKHDIVQIWEFNPNRGMWRMIRER